MTADAKSNAFNISVATVMIGPMDQVKDLTPEEHSIGLVKNFSMSNTLNYVELTSGLHGDVVDSQATSSDTSASCEVYEYTPENVAYALGLEGSGYTANGKFNVKTKAEGGSSTVEIEAETDPSVKFPTGQTIMIQATYSKNFDRVLMRKVASCTWADGTLTITLDKEIPTGWTVSAGDRVIVSNFIPVGTEDAQPYFGCKVVGILPNDNVPVVLILPKVRITNGFSIGFSTDDYQNMPFEITPYKLVPGDALYDEHKNDGFAFVEM